MQPESYHARPAPARQGPARVEQVQRRRLVFVVCMLGLMVIVTAVASHSCREDASAAGTPAEPTGTSLDPFAGLVSASYQAQLTASSPDSAASTAAAVLTLDYDSDTEELTYSLEVTGALANPSTAGICQGPLDQNGNTVFTLFPGPTAAGDFSGVLSQGAIVPEDLVGPLAGGTLADLVRLVESGGAYATIGTQDCPVDAVRGRIG